MIRKIKKGEAQVYGTELLRIKQKKNLNVSKAKWFFKSLRQTVLISYSNLSIGTKNN